jgi:glucose-1-phosphate adenylyltransferase
LWGIRTNLEDRDVCYKKPALIKKHGNVKNSIIGKGCEIEGEVVSSIIFPGVKIAKKSLIKHSVIMHDCFIGEHVFMDMAVLDKDIKVEEDVNVGVGQNIPNIRYPEIYNFGITVIGKKAELPAGLVVGKNCLIQDTVSRYDFKDWTVPSGTSVFR